VTWSLGVNRVAAIAAEDAMLPAALGRLHPRYKTPHVAFVIMGWVATALLVGNALLSSGPSNVFWMIFKLFEPLSAAVLSRHVPGLPDPAVQAARRTTALPTARGPGRRLGGHRRMLALRVLTSLLFFKPAPGAEQPVKEALLLAGETLLTMVAGALLVPRRARSKT